MKEVKISIATLVGGGICVSADDGNKVHAAVYEEIRKGNRIVISFSGITRMTTAFLNAALGQLYGEFSETEIRKHLAPPVDAEPWQLNRLKLVVDRAKSYFSNPGAAQAAFIAVTGINDDEDPNN
jgi:hypothetical protein